MPIQEEISQRASPNRCDGRDDDDPEEIQPSITRGEHSTHRKDGNAPKIEGMEDHRSSRNAERARSPAASEPCERAVRCNVKLGLCPGVMNKGAQFACQCVENRGVRNK